MTPRRPRPAEDRRPLARRDRSDPRRRRRAEGDPRALLPGRTLGLYFGQPSTRTRISFSVAMAQLGGTPITLLPGEMQLSRGESLEDTAQVLSRYVDALAIRTLSHDELEAWAEACTIPVINALTEVEHPCQALADAMTIRERLGAFDGVRIAWVGDGTNVLVSLAHLALAVGMDVIAACPEGYDPPAGTPLELTRDPREAARNADVLVTDIWVSLGQEATRERRLRDLEPYRLDDALVELANPEAVEDDRVRRSRARAAPRRAGTARGRAAAARASPPGRARPRCR